MYSGPAEMARMWLACNLHVTWHESRKEANALVREQQMRWIQPMSDQVLTC